MAVRSTVRSQNSWKLLTSKLHHDPKIQQSKPTASKINAKLNKESKKTFKIEDMSEAHILKLKEENEADDRYGSHNITSDPLMTTEVIPKLEIHYEACDYEQSNDLQIKTEVVYLPDCKFSCELADSVEEPTRLKSLTEDSSLASDPLDDAVHSDDLPDTQATFSQTIDTHTSLRSLKCGICSKVFTYKSQLKRHMFYHSDSNKFKCPGCEMAFAMRGTLITHMADHSDFKPYKCDNCDKVFATNASLFSHKAVHTTLKSHECNVCKRVFRAKHNFNNHMMSAHIRLNAQKLHLW